MEVFTLLLIEDEPAELSRLERIFDRSNLNCKIIKASTPVAACNQFRKYSPEVVILDLGLKGYGPASGLDLISTMNSIDPTARIVTLTGHTADEIGTQAIKNGAASFLCKPANVPVLISLVKDYAQTAKFKRHALSNRRVETVGRLIGSASTMQKVYQLIHQCAQTEANVLVVGETGTGKELVAHAIHDLSARHKFELSVYFGAAPASMFEAEIFGYTRGAYTGANPKGQFGAVKRADKSTLFIDELCSLDLDIQRKLLRLVEQKVFKPLGAEGYEKSDFRLICAAQPRIYNLVRSGQFREDLLSRVEVVTIEIPPLRDRKEDILILAHHFQILTKRELFESGIVCNVLGFTNEALKLFTEHSWPRNVRQLRHTGHNGMIQAQLRGAERIDAIDVISRLKEDLTPFQQNQPKLLAERITLKDAVEKLEIELISSALSRHNNVYSTVAQELGLGRTTLWRKLKHYAIE